MKTVRMIVGTDACAIIMVKHNHKQALVYFECF